ncbi:hypothetical protein BD410DRAFT_806408 [Rickenella mellea]|uniref:Uncharacterized protein n=1 Tax=Rickenella mellea TaxID=50990 RepID=A0A4Y7PTH1_9AGAM|nr:hypothetical protein BD410DRAFT_806408 [Rickenella mellea]
MESENRKEKGRKRGVDEVANDGEEEEVAKRAKLCREAVAARKEMVREDRKRARSSIDDNDDDDEVSPASSGGTARELDDRHRAKRTRRSRDDGPSTSHGDASPRFWDDLRAVRDEVAGGRDLVGRGVLVWRTSTYRQHPLPPPHYPTTTIPPTTPTQPSSTPLSPSSSSSRHRPRATLPPAHAHIPARRTSTQTSSRLYTAPTGPRSRGRGRGGPTATTQFAGTVWGVGGWRRLGEVWVDLVIARLRMVRDVWGVNVVLRLVVRIAR